VSGLAVQPDCTVSRKVMSEYVPRGKPDGRVAGSTTDVGVEGLSVSVLGPVVGLA
jgi:hypothetical protein